LLYITTARADRHFLMFFFFVGQKSCTSVDFLQKY